MMIDRQIEGAKTRRRGPPHDRDLRVASHSQFASWFLAAGLVMFSGGCGGDHEPKDAWRLEDPADAETSNDGVEQQANDVGPSFSAPERDEPCAATEVSVFMVPEQPGYLGVLHEDRLFLSLTYLQRSDIREVVELTDEGAFRPVTPPAQTVARPLAAADGQLWFTDGAQLNRLYLESGTLREEAVAPPAELPPYRYHAQTSPQAGGDRFGWLESGNARLFDGGTVRELPGEAAAPPWVSPEHVAWFGTNDGRYFVAVDDHWVEDSVPLSWPVVAGEEALFLRDGHPTRLGLDSGVMTPVELPPVDQTMLCGSLHSDGALVVAGCTYRDGSFPESANYGAVGASWVTLFMPGHARPIFEHRATEGLVFAPVLSGAWVAWLEFDDSRFDRDARPGRVMVMNLRDGKAIEIDAVEWRCGRDCERLPTPTLALDGNTLAWNYAVSSDAPNMPHFGVARLRDTCPVEPDKF